ncbi:hypothetical protein Asru_0155_02 [Acidisphaera rubrifaciens HS-AP3]|uniref:Uncharacterized protein n=1 Tax=Acidisphaera rubrifaciens HS-AP3 TaxID=1231350 RepID=A0A0D6P4P1_9PROT|nr:hypothetical protein Asru_0155_02 [Acidisphaera rubrifaciens HS-AP3]
MAASARDVPDPCIRHDAALGLVVIELRDRAGAVIRTLPSAAQIAAYRRWVDTGDGPDPFAPDPGAVAAEAPAG